MNQKESASVRKRFTMLLVDDDRRADRGVVVDLSDLCLRRIHTAVGTVAHVVGVAVSGTPARVVDAVAVALERDPVVDKGAVARTGKVGVARLVQNAEIALGRIAGTLVAGNNLSSRDLLAVLVIPHVLLIDADLDIGVAGRPAVSGLDDGSVLLYW